MGTFVGYDEQGNELYRIRVKQAYQTINSTTQQVTIEDLMPDGAKITGKGENVAQWISDGSLSLRCTVVKSNGDRAEHEGRLVKEPGGNDQIIWHTRKPDRVEIFHEVVRKEGQQLIYEINGTGLYGKILILMRGRYEKRSQGQSR